ncbi:MAG: hypothetical protein RL348_837, partial [Bacteroidota bacterium]
MAYFDTRTFLTLSGRGEPLTTAVGTAFGMPTCLLNLSNQLLAALFPSKVLRQMKNSTKRGADAADRAIKNGLAELKFLDGIIEYDESTGTFRLVSRSSRNGIDEAEDDSILGLLGAIAGFAGRIYNVIELATNEVD